MDWRTEWFEFEGVAYLNAAGESPLPRISVRAVQAALEWKKYPHQLSDSAYFELPNRIRASVARLIGGQPEEIALIERWIAQGAVYEKHWSLIPPSRPPI